MNKEKSLIKSNQPESTRKNQFWCGSTNHLQITSRDFPMEIFVQKAKILALEMGLYQYEPKKEG